MAETKKKTVKTASALPSASRKKEPSFLGSAMPLYAGILLLVLGLVAGFGFHQVFFPVKVIVQPGPDCNAAPEAKFLEFTVVFNPVCKLCSNLSSLQPLLKQQGVDSNAILLDSSSSDGIETVQSFGIDSFPVALVKVDSLKKVNPGLFVSLNASFATKNGFLVLPEKDLMMQTKVPSEYMLKEIPADANCSVLEGKAVVWEFGDLLAESTYDALPQTMNLLSQFSSSELEYSFKYLYVSNTDSEKAALADACAKKMGKFKEFHNALMERFGALNYPIWDWDEQRQAAEIAGITDLNAFKACIDSKEFLETVAYQTGTDTLQGQAFSLQQIPSYVVDCQFVVINPLKLEEALCKQHPEFGACDAS